MRDTRILMGMPITIEISDGNTAWGAAPQAVFDFFKYVDDKFSTYKSSSEISAINQGFLTEKDYSDDMREVLKLCEETKQATNGYFDIRKADGSCDPSGLVKGWSIYRAAQILKDQGIDDFYVDAGGDIEACGRVWTIGIKNPFNEKEIIKVVYLKDRGIATSGTYTRGLHIYNPHNQEPANAIASLTVIGPNVYEADRFATAAFAMGEKGIEFIEKLNGFEGYMVDHQGIATMTTGFETYTKQL